MGYSRSIIDILGFWVFFYFCPWGGFRPVLENVVLFDLRDGLGFAENDRFVSREELSLPACLVAEKKEEKKKEKRFEVFNLMIYCVVFFRDKKKKRRKVLKYKKLPKPIVSARTYS